MNQNPEELEVGEVLDESIDFKRITWTIPDALNLPQHDINYKIQTSSFAFANGTWKLEMYPYGHAYDSSDWFINLIILRMNSEIPVHDIFYKFCFITRQGKEFDTIAGNAQFNSSLYDCGISFMKRSKFIRMRNVLVPDGVLTIMCEMQTVKDPVFERYPSFESASSLSVNLPMAVFRRYTTDSPVGYAEMTAESHKQKIAEMQDILPNVPKDLCVKVLQYYGNDVDEAVDAFFRDGVEALSDLTFSGCRHSKDYRDCCNYYDDRSTDGRTGFEEKPNNIVLITLMTPSYPVTTDLMHTICCTYGKILRIVILKKIGITQAMVEYESVKAAEYAKQSLDNCDLLAECPPLKVEFAKNNKIKNKGSNKLDLAGNAATSFDADQCCNCTSKLFNLKVNLKELFLKQEDCDVIIKVKGREFPAHRNILKARSSVFAATFRNSMKEKATGVIDIEDCDPSSFSDFLCFLYCGHVEKLSTENVFNLFTTADKYDVQDLRLECMEFVKKNLSVNTFCDTITLALQHSEKELVELATNFFGKNLQEIIMTVEWQSFLVKNPIQGNELLIKALASNKK